MNNKKVFQKNGPNSPKKRPPQKVLSGKQKSLIIFALFLLVVVVSALAVVTIQNKKVQIKEDASLHSGGVSAVTQQPVERRVRFSAVGDNLIHDGIYLQAAERAGGNGYDFSYIYDNVTDFFEPFDVNWINQETLVNNVVAPSGYPTFSSPGALGKAAYDAGWSVFALSNNHTYDKGVTGLEATMDFWDSMPQDVLTPGLFTGDDEKDIQTHVVNDVSIAYLSFTEHTNGLPTPEGAPAHIIYNSDTAVIQQYIEKAKTMADVVVVGMHWGVENSHDVSTEQRELAASLANWGADLIIGTHPHVIQPIEWIEKENGEPVLVVYSLGNFISAQAQADNLIGMALTLDIVQNQDASGEKQPVTIENVKAYPTITHYDANYRNIHNYMAVDYTEELAGRHGVRARYPNFNRDYIFTVFNSYVDDEFIDL